MAWTMILSEQLNRIMTALDIGPDELARALDTNRRTVLRWLADSHVPQGASRKRLDELEALVDRFESTFKTREGSQAWLRSECGYFGGLRPIDALLSGRVDRVDAALEALDAGVFV